MAKLTVNSFRDTNIAFANELSILCDKFNIDVWELIALKFENKNGRKAKVACMGLAFKPNISEYAEFDIIEYKDATDFQIFLQ